MSDGLRVARRRLWQACILTALTPAVLTLDVCMPATLTGFFSMNGQGMVNAARLFTQVVNAKG